MPPPPGAHLKEKVDKIVEKNFEDLQGLTDELVVVVFQLLLRVPAVAIVGGIRHLPAIAWVGAPEMYVSSERLLQMD